MELEKSAKYYKMYKDALDFHKSKFESYKENVAYYELEQNYLSQFVEKPWVYQINTPFATDAVNIRVSSLQANDYTGALEPLSPEDVEAVDQLNQVYREKWNEMNMDKVISDSILSGAVLGEAYAHVIMDAEKTYGGTNRKNKGTFYCYFLDTPSVHIDPKALGLKDADYVVVSERVTSREVEKQFPNLDLKNKPTSGAPEDRGEIYVGNNYTSEQDKDVFTKITIYEKTKEGIEKTVLIDRHIAKETTLMDINVFPIAQFRWQKKLKAPYGTSLMSMLLPLQKVLNEIESANANANMQYSSPSYVMSEDCGINPAALAASAGAPAAVYTVRAGVNVNEVIAPLIPNRGIDQGLVTTKQELERSIYKLAGVTDEFKGDIGTPGNTSGGAELTLQRAKTIEERVLTNIEEYVEDLTRIIVELISKGFAGDTIYSRGDKKSDGSYNFKSFKVPENAGEIEYNFYIELNVRTQYSKEKQKQVLMELFQNERQYDTGDVKALNTLDLIKVMNIPQSEEIIERYKRATQMDASQRAQMIQELVSTGEQLNVDPQLVNGAISEILLNLMETPNMDMFMQVAEQARMQQEQEQQVIQQAAMTQQLEMAQNEQLGTGEETFSPVSE